MKPHLSTRIANASQIGSGYFVRMRAPKKRMSAATWASQRSSIFVVTVLTPATT